MMCEHYLCAHALLAVETVQDLFLRVGYETTYRISVNSFLPSIVSAAIIQFMK